MLFVEGGFAYIMTNMNHTVLYVGVSGNLKKRTIQHREKRFPGFSSRYNCSKLVYYFHYPTITEAIAEEKRIKAGSRIKKIALINSINPEWKDLWEDVKNW